jgi:hypothetical protein
VVAESTEDRRSLRRRLELQPRTGLRLSSERIGELAIRDPVIGERQVIGEGRDE